MPFLGPAISVILISRPHIPTPLYHTITILSITPLSSFLPLSAPPFPSPFSLFVFLVAQPYSSPVDAATQLKRVLPVLDFIEKENINLPISIDTRSAKVAEEVLKRGNYIINDVSGFDYDKGMPEIIAKYNATVILQHSQGTPDKMQDNPNYNNVVEDIYLALYKKIEFAKSLGIENIIIDPGIGFGKTKQNNLDILSRIEDFYTLKRPVMVGISRKSFLGNGTNEEKDIYTLAINSLLIEKRVDYLRVHNVKLHKDFTDIIKNA